MTTIDRTQGFERHWGTFQTLTPLVQSTPGSTFDHSLGNVNCQVVGTRTWKLGDANIPVVSGNSIRAALRRALAYHLFAAIGADKSEIVLSAAHLLVAGGALGQMENNLTPDRVSEIRDMFPSLALLGGTPIGGFLHGRLMVGNWVAQTANTPRPILHPDYREAEDLPPADATLFMDLYAKSQFEAPEQYKADARDGQAVAQNTGRTANDPMPYGYKAVAPGIAFAGWVALGVYKGLDAAHDEVQRACLRFGLERAFRLDEDGQVALGLRASSGYGIVHFDWDVSRIAASTDPYLDFIDDNADRIRATLASNDLVPRTRTRTASRRNANQPASQVPSEPDGETSASDDDDIDDETA